MEVASQINTFLLAGYETTASALAFTVYHVARNPEKEAKLLAEVDAFGRSRAPTLEDLDQLPYLDAVFNEALRVSPPAAFGTIRVAREDMDICGCKIRKGWYLNTAQFSTHRNPKYWEDSEAFKPERFMDGKAAANPAFSPFGDGGRNCIGLRFAKAEAKIALIRLYQHHTLRLVPGQEPLETRTTITMSPKHGVMVTVHPRP
jgi:cytochrome P450